MDVTITFASAMGRLAMAGLFWCLALAYALPRSTSQLSRGAVLALALVAVGWVAGQPLWLSYDSTVDLALGRRCAEGVCPTVGSLASEAGFALGVLWDWILAALFVVDDSPVWLRLSLLAAHAVGAGVVAAIPEDARVGVGSGVLFFALCYGLAPGYVAWHPTLAPVAIAPAVMLATQRAAKPDRRRDYPRAVLLGASYGVALGVYVAALLLCALLVLGLLRGRIRELPAIACGLLLEQVLVTPHAAWNNAMELGSEAAVVGVVVLGVVLFARHRAPAWMLRCPAAAVLALTTTTFVVAALVAEHAIYPFYVALLAPVVAAALAEIRRVDRRAWMLRAAFASVAAAVVVVSSWFYRRATEDHHEGLYSYRDLHALAEHFHGGYGVAVSSPSYALFFSFPVWANVDPVRAAGRGIALWRDGDPAPGICAPRTEHAAGELHLCEYSSWVRSEGSRVCIGRIEESRDAECRRFSDAAAFDLSTLESPIHYPRHEEPPLQASFFVPVCVDGNSERILEPVVFPRLAVRALVKIRPPTWGRLTESKDAVQVTADAPTCGMLEWEWNGDAVPLVPWERDTVPAEVFEQLVFFVRERAP